MVMQSDPVPFAEPAEARSYARHRARDLVAEDAGSGEQAPLDLLDVGPAHAAGVHPHQHLPRQDLRHRDLLDPQDARSPVDGGEHGHGRVIIS